VSDLGMKGILSEMASQLDGVLLLTVMDSDCMVLASWESPDNKVSPETLGEFIQQIKSVISTFKQSANGTSKLDDIVLSTYLGYVMLMPICNGSCFIVAGAPRNTSLGSVRKAFTKNSAKLEQAIPGYEAVASLKQTSTSSYSST
jgi:predicted regulator of Ras-like GTPase activity (Roadblock/LC7/MglB family)